MAKKQRLPVRAYIRGIAGAAAMSFRIAPGAVAFKLGGAILDAILPLLTVYLAAQTTTELAYAYAGDAGAGQRAITYVVFTMLIGLFTTVWASIDNYIQAILRFTVEAKVSDMMYERFLALDFWRYEDKDTIDTYDKAQQFGRFYAYVFDQLSSIFSQLVSMIGAIVALLLFVPWVAAIIGVAILPGIYLQFKLSRAQIDQWNKNVTARRAQSNIEWQLLQPKSIIELRLNGLVRYLLQLRSHYRDQDERIRIQFEKKYISKQVLSNVLESTAELISLVWVTFEIMKQTQPIGQFLYVQQVVSRAIGSTNSLVRS
ncbi:ABC transporter ATP-binding protein, partial [Candidatus Saccharibacteria bacterium]|nr:ABC transporter ATP-binding protein [Candidatus Saccharibacteria bacterium]